MLIHYRSDLLHIRFTFEFNSHLPFHLTVAYRMWTVNRTSYDRSSQDLMQSIYKMHCCRQITENYSRSPDQGSLWKEYALNYGSFWFFFLFNQVSGPFCILSVSNEYSQAHVLWIRIKQQWEFMSYNRITQLRA